ncbi:MAG: CHASE2 domain-containing protein [Candidatus Gracilibacteria bacterium]
MRLLYLEGTIINKVKDSIVSYFFVNGIILILSFIGIFDIANTISLRNIANSITSENVYSTSNKSLTLMISNTFFEKEFKSKTPLDKDKLYTLLNNIIMQKPKSIIFDLDISPDYDFSNLSKNLLNHKLYNLLKKHAININIILPFAFISDTQENKRIKKEWIKEMCTANIKFALPFLDAEMGVALRYHDYNNNLSLGQVSNLSICADVLSTTNIENLQNKYQKKYNQSEKYPINYKNIQTSTIILNSMNDLKKYDLTDKSIFLGGGYGFSDKYITPYGEKYGVQIHEAIFYTISHKIDRASIYITILIDFLLAISFGILIEQVLEKREKITTLNSLVFNNVLLFFILIVFVLISMETSNYMYHNLYIWLNPIPIIIGMFLDSIIGASKKNITNTKKNAWLYNIMLGIFVLAGIWAMINDLFNL